MFNPLLHPLTLAEPAWPRSGDAAWRAHVPFAFYLVSALRPAQVVELAARLGDSYCALCQAAQSLKLPTQCAAYLAYAEEAGEDAARLLAYHHEHYSGFASLQRRDFAQAPAEQAIDLLQLAGPGGAEALRRDFNDWLPRLNPGGVVLLSGIGPEPREYAQRQFWLELQERYPHFEFEHAGGLGVLAPGNAPPVALRALFEASAAEAETIRQFFARLGGALNAATAPSEASHHAAFAHVAQQNREIRRLHTRNVELEQIAQQLNRQLLALTNSRAWRLVERGWRLRRMLTGQKDAPASAPPPAVATSPQVEEDYAQWLARHTPDATALAAQRAAARAFGYRPLISLLTPVYRTPPAILRATLASVLRQSYEDWELCLTVAADEGHEVRRVLDEHAGRDARIRVTTLPQNLGIAANTNAALAGAQGEFVAWLDHDDELAPDALYEYARRLNADPATDVFYSDEDKLDPAGQPCQPFFKPDWSPEYLRGVMYAGHLLCVRRSLLNEVGGCLSRFDGVQDFELLLRLSERTAHIVHVPRILYHWRQLPGSIAHDSAAKANIGALQCAAVNEQLQRLQLPARAEIATPWHQLRSVPQRPAPPVSLIVAPADAAAELPSWLTRDPKHEVIVAEPAGSAARAYNLSARQAHREYLVFLDSAFAPETPDWLAALAYYAAQPEVGAAGGLLLDQAGAVEHAGYVLAADGAAQPLMRGFTLAAGGYAGSLVCARETAAVASACLMIKRSRFEELGGFNEYFQRQFYDVDLCLRLRAAGQRIIVTPAARWRRRVGQAAGLEPDAVDQALLLDLWRAELEGGDPYYNPNFAPAQADYSLRR